MALEAIDLPHIPSYDFGVGIDRLTGSAFTKVVRADPGMITTVQYASGATQLFTVQRIQTSKQLEQAIGIDVNASLGCGVFGPTISERFSFVERNAVTSFSLYMTVTTVVHLADLSIDEPKLTQAAADVVNNEPLFTARYGNMFARACSRGGRYVGILKIETKSEQDVESIENDLNGSYSFFAADVKGKFSEIRNKYNVDFYCTRYAEGGPTLDALTDPSDPAFLLTDANHWLSGIMSDPDRLAVPYIWVFSPTTIAEGPLPPNAVQIVGAEEVLRFCAGRRSVLTDRLNQLTWIVDNASRFDWARADSPATLSDAADNLQTDLDLITDCASVALVDPASARYPADFAISEGRTYPATNWPLNLPDPRPGTPATPPVITVTVPDVTGMNEATATASLRGLGLKVQSVSGILWDPLASSESPIGLVQDQIPESGNSIPATVTVTIVVTREVKYHGGLPLAHLSAGERAGISRNLLGAARLRRTDRRVIASSNAQPERKMGATVAAVPSIGRRAEQRQNARVFQDAGSDRQIDPGDDAIPARSKAALSGFKS